MLITTYEEFIKENIRHRQHKYLFIAQCSNCGREFSFWKGRATNSYTRTFLRIKKTGNIWCEKCNRSLAQKRN